MLKEQFRQAAIAWLKSDKRDYNEGLNILIESGFKPGVARRIKMLGENDQSKMHLVENIRQYISMFGEDVPDTDSELGVFNGENPEELHSEEDGIGDGEEVKTIEALAKDIEDGKVEAGDRIGALIVKYAAAYRNREKNHRKLSEIPEDNTPEHIAARKALVAEIAKDTDLMETLYPTIKPHLDLKEDIPEEEAAKVGASIEALANKATDPDPKSESEKTSESANENLDALSKDELQKRIKSVKTKILRKNNLLLYQKETKAEVENPMPECPKRTKYETEIANLEKELEALQYALARKG